MAGKLACMQFHPAFQQVAFLWTKVYLLNFSDVKWLCWVLNTLPKKTPKWLILNKYWLMLFHAFEQPWPEYLTLCRNCVDATTHDGIDLYFHLQSIFIPRYMGCSSRQVFAHQGHSSVTSPLQALEDYSRVFLSSLIIDLQYWPKWK